MAAAKYDIEIEQGATFQKLARLRDAAGELIDLTDYTAKMQIRLKKESAAAVISLDETDGLTLGGAAGTIQIEIPAASTAELTKRNYVYDLFITSEAGIATKVLEGNVCLDFSVTR